MLTGILTSSKKLMVLRLENYATEDPREIIVNLLNFARIIIQITMEVNIFNSIV